MTDTQTAALKAGRQVYDVIITDGGGKKTKVFEGTVMVYESVAV